MENPNWLVGIRVCRISQVVCPSTVVYLTKFHKKLLAILFIDIVLQVEAAKVYLGGSTVPAAVVIVVKYRACLLVSQLIVGV